MKRLRSPGSRQRSSIALAATLVLAVAAVVTIGAWLVADPGTPRSDALRTAGIAGGAIIALYALWLNDRRRRVEEARHALEGDRVSDERFARSVELLGHDADQVRVGAMHALAGLAKARPDYTQTVLDVLCAYLRRPYSHPRWSDTGNLTAEEHEEAERELQVRLTAQRLVYALLSTSDDPDGIDYDLDLTGAAVEYLDLSHRRMGTVVLRYVYLHSDSNLSRCVFTGPVWFSNGRTGTGRLQGRFRCDDTVFEQPAAFRDATFDSLASFRRTRFADDCSFSGAAFNGTARFTDATFGELDLRRARFAGDIDLRWREAAAVSVEDTEADPARSIELPDGWRVTPVSSGAHLTPPATGTD
ncbi:pentapeptide repeat-containing protein [Prauserella halophila]|uniref:Pentapeptide repeat-containing protein n=1 Tax=Prauserella halophila TaxID=185641 RepID=A0ABN1WCM2_9PSEU|nr:pentapeptide repeat-containing protein [Prauserella halophila]MCP2236925.1 Pentapeptide repeat-containing protein [Prauserella halophila]